MSILTFINADILFIEWKLIWRLYTPAKALSITKQVYIIDFKEFAIAVLDPSKKSFVVHVIYIGKKMSIYLA